jgi:hypothetical protein
MPQQEHPLNKPFSTALRIAKPAVKLQGSDAARSGLGHSALKFRPLAVAIRGGAIYLVAIHGTHTADCQGPQHTFEREA